MKFCFVFNYSTIILQIGIKIKATLLHSHHSNQRYRCTVSEACFTTTPLQGYHMQHTSTFSSSNVKHTRLASKQCPGHQRYCSLWRKGNRTCRWWNHISRVHSSGQGLQHKHSRIFSGWTRLLTHTLLQGLPNSGFYFFPWLHSVIIYSRYQISQSTVFHLISYEKLVQRLWSSF